MAEITIYQKPTCSTCREAVRIVRESGQPFKAINYYEQPFTKSRLKALLKKAGLTAREVLRTKEDLYKSLKLADPAMSEDHVLGASADAVTEGPTGMTEDRTDVRIQFR